MICPKCNANNKRLTDLAHHNVNIADEPFAEPHYVFGYRCYKCGRVFTVEEGIKE